MESMPMAGLQRGLGMLSMVSSARTRSISRENPTGGKGMGARAEVDPPGQGPSRDLGRGWKVDPAVQEVAPGETLVLADIEGPGVIQHIWMTTFQQHHRKFVLRMYWDGWERPSVEVPLGDFFAQGWSRAVAVNSLPVSVNPHGGLNCYWEMPFAKGARITVQNVSREPAGPVFFQITYAETEVPAECGRFHAQFRRANPLGFKEEHRILDGVRGPGHYVGTYLAWQTNTNQWWGEGEIKFFLDGDEEFPTICGTGTEDYFGGAWGFAAEPGAPRYATYSTPFLGFHQILPEEGPHFAAGNRFGMYRWHVMDPVRFARDLRVRIQALGWHIPEKDGARFKPLRDDISSTAFWYQQGEPPEFPPLPQWDDLEVV